MFLLDDSSLAWMYAIPFLFALFLPGWRSVIVAGIATTAVAGLAANDVQNSHGPGAILGFVYIMVGYAGALSGIAARAASLRVAPIAKRPVWFAVIAATCFFGGATIFSGRSATWAWLVRPSMATCRASVFDVQVGNTILNLPAAPFFSVRLFGKTTGYEHGIFLMEFKRGLRDICSKRNLQDAPMGPAIVSVRNRIGSVVRAWIESHCSPPASLRDDLLCNGKSRAPAFQEATFYSDEAAKFVNSTYAVQVKARAEAVRPQQRTDIPEKRGIFDVYSDGLHIARGADWGSVAGEPFTSFCDEGPGACAAIERMDNGILVGFMISKRKAVDGSQSGDGQLAQDMRDVRKYLAELVRELTVRSP